jgi:hypothetical protein
MIATGNETGRRSHAAAPGTVEWLSLGATPSFAFMAALSGILGGGAPDMMCSAASPMPALSGMVPMYALMSAFHVAPWLKLISRWRSRALAEHQPITTGATHGHE